MINEKLWFRWKALATAMNTCQSLKLYGTKQSKYILRIS